MAGFVMRMTVLRRLRDLTFEDLGEITGLDPAYLRSIEAGTKHATGSELALIADALGFEEEPEYLLLAI